MLALWRVTDPGNVGTLMRTADAFGAAVSLSPECADPLGPRAVRASAGAIFRVPLVEWDDTPDRCVALVAHGGVPLCRHRPRALRSRSFSAPSGKDCRKAWCHSVTRRRSRFPARPSR